MRFITVRSGVEENKHPIFDSLEHFKSTYPDMSYKIWYSPEIRKDNWVLTDDSRVMQCINVTALLNEERKIRKAYYTFPNGTYTVYPSFRIPALYADYMKPIIEYDKRKYYFTDEEVKLIVKLILTGSEVLKACYLIKPKSSNKTIKFIMRDLAENPKFKEYMKAELTTFTSELETRFNDELILTHIEDLLSHSRKGTQSHRENSMFVMAIRGQVKTNDG